jgi:hypothetical protein
MQSTSSTLHAAAHALQSVSNRLPPDPRFRFLDLRIQRFSHFLEKNLDVSKKQKNFLVIKK